MAQCGSHTWIIDLCGDYKGKAVIVLCPQKDSPSLPGHEDKQLSLDNGENRGQAWRPEVPEV